MAGAPVPAHIERLFKDVGKKKGVGYFGTAHDTASGGTAGFSLRMKRL
jgi:hypothetical protein